MPLRGRLPEREDAGEKMGILSVIVAAAAAWIFGAAWYMVLGQRWSEAQGLDDDALRERGAAPYVISFFLLVLTAGMIRHVLITSGVGTVGGAFVAGLGLGAFVAAPWVAMGIVYTGRPVSLLWIDGLYPVIGCGIIGAVLSFM